MVYAKKSKTIKQNLLGTDETSSPATQSQHQCMVSEETTRGTHHSTTTAISSKHHPRVHRDVTTSCDRVLRSRKSSHSGVNHRLHEFIGRPQKRLFTPEIKRKLKEWLVKRRRYPYPTREEKHRLAQDTGLDYNQICNWFANWRRKLKNAECEGYSDAGDKSDTDEENNADIERSGNGPINGSLSWGRRILLYNHVAARNAEKIPIASDDSLLEDEHDFDDEFSSESETKDCSYLTPSGFLKNEDPQCTLDTTAMDHCYSLLPQPNTSMDSNGNYKISSSHEKMKSNISPNLLQAKKWIESVERYKPQKQVKNNQLATTWAATNSVGTEHVAAKTSYQKGPRPKQRHLGKDEIDAAEALTALARASRR